MAGGIEETGGRGEVGDGVGAGGAEGFAAGGEEGEGLVMVVVMWGGVGVRDQGLVYRWGVEVVGLWRVKSGVIGKGLD